MQSLVGSLAIASIILSVTFLVWSSLRYLDHNDWTLPTLESTQHADLVSELMSENSRLQALQALQPPLLDTELMNETLTEENEDSGSTVDHADEGFAYVFYATTDPYACSILVNIHRLQKLLNVSYPVHVLVSSSISHEYMAAFGALNAIVHVEKAPPLEGHAAGYYQDCLLKLVAFKLHQLDPTLKRVLAFDSDQLVMKNHDHLFAGLPDVDLAAPRAYWLAKDFLASTFLMISLSDRLWHTVESALATVQYNKFDMDLINDLLGETVMMLSGEYVTLDSHWEDWGLPSWYHASEGLNLTTVKLYNQLLKAGLKPERLLAARQDPANNGSNITSAANSNQPGNLSGTAQSSHTHTVVTSSPNVFSTRPQKPNQEPANPHSASSHQLLATPTSAQLAGSKFRFQLSIPSHKSCIIYKTQLRLFISQLLANLGCILLIRYET